MITTYYRAYHKVAHKLFTEESYSRYESDIKGYYLKEIPCLSHWHESRESLLEDIRENRENLQYGPPIVILEEMKINWQGS